MYGEYKLSETCEAIWFNGEFFFKAFFTFEKISKAVYMNVPNWVFYFFKKVMIIANDLVAMKWQLANVCYLF
jgi:hypothetical protein